MTKLREVIFLIPGKNGGPFLSVKQAIQRKLFCPGASCLLPWSLLPSALCLQNTRQKVKYIYNKTVLLN
ncbi:MAG: hypothetical protein F6K47_06470 [Symploca sp. SIO2E6]|nr:hypothetical protein [Symploca sp. SIO2E6]